MLLEHAEDLVYFLDELEHETDRGLPLVGAAVIDEKLHETLKAFFVKRKSSTKLLSEPNAPLGTFSSRIEACYALALIDEFEYNEIGLIRKIRNEFAHAKHGVSFENEKIKKLCTSLQSPFSIFGKCRADTPRFRLRNAIVCIVLRLYHRSEWVVNERLQPRTWVPDSRWYITNENSPRKNEGFMGLVPIPAKDEG
ncbi:MAG: MltR family transcriptional regulator [Kiritimatiellia bacterium]|jgi:mannitol operon repressor